MAEVLKRFGATVRELRKNLKLTQEQLGELSELHPVYVSEVERGIRNPSLESIVKLSGALKVTPDDLMSLVFQPDAEHQEIKKQIMTLINQQSLKDLKTLLAIFTAYLETRRQPPKS